MIIQLSCCWSEFEVSFRVFKLRNSVHKSRKCINASSKAIYLCKQKKASKPFRTSRLRDYEIIFFADLLQQICVVFLQALQSVGLNVDIICYTLGIEVLHVIDRISCNNDVLKVSFQQRKRSCNQFRVFVI